MSKLFFKNALLPDGWAENVAITCDARGLITAVEKDANAGAVSGEIAVPGIANVHSHAFQRAMAGLGEWRGGGKDDFWSWREVMYRFVQRLRPEDIGAVAAQLYVEMLEAGYTSVGEFHYVHNQPDGTPYDDVAETSERIVEAAQQSGIGLALLPVLYAHGDFGGKPLGEDQLRFRHDADSFSTLLERCRELTAKKENITLGVAPHSLRAVTQEQLAALIEISPAGPFHIHIAEQEKEVAASVAWSGARPVEWLLEHCPVNERWCLIHATHMTSEETSGVAASGAVAGLCPTTEANLGDGIFNGVEYLEAGGRWGVGTDSHIRVDAAEELRGVETSQRLRDRQRVRLARAGEANGRRLFEEAAAGGAQALGVKSGAIAPGKRADIVVLDAGHPLFIGKSKDDWLNAWVFAGDKSCISDVWSGGRHLVKEGAHVRRDAALNAFKTTMAHLMA